MALPNKERTWQYNVNQAVSMGADITATLRTVLLAIKNSMKGFALSPWTVVGSCNSTAAGMDGVDRWSTTSNLIWSGSGVHSWIILAQAGLGTLQVAISLKANQPNNLIFSVSPGGLFTGGTTSAKPTATDEINLLNGGVWAPSTNVPLVVHVMQSQDGYATRMILCGSATSLGLWLMEKPGSVPTPQAGFPGWTNPFIVHAGGNTSATTVYATYTTFNDGAPVKGYGNSAEMALYLTSEGFISSMIGEQFATVANELTGEWSMAPVGLASTTSGRRGRHARMVDVWWGSTVQADGTTYPGDGSRQFVQFGHLIHPWNGSIPLMV